jgi:hypothetical protein
MTQIAQIFKHQLPILFICENLQSVDDLHFRLPPYCGCPPWATLLTYPWDMRYRAGVRSRSVDSQDLPDLLLLRSCLAAVYLDLPRRSRFTLASGCLRQSFSLRSIMSPYGLPSAGSVGSHSSQNVSPYGLLLCSLPRNRPVAWFPASSRWHVFRFPVSGLPPSRPLMQLGKVTVEGRFLTSIFH